MDAISQDRLQAVHPILQSLVQQLDAVLTPQGIHLRVVQGLRTMSEQQALWEQGRTAPGSVVTNARPGDSWHNYGCACFDEITQVLTGQGWMPFAQLGPDAVLAAFNGESIRYERPVSRQAYWYQGEAVRVETRSVDLLTTTNHKFIARRRGGSNGWENVRADRLDRNSIIPMIAPFEESATPEYPFDDEISAEDWWAFMGWYLSEGHCCGCSDGIPRTHNSRFRVSISQVKAHGREKIEALLSRMKLRHAYHGHEFIVHSKDLWQVLLPVGNSLTKRMPRYLLNAPKHLLRRLCDALIDGDGSRYPGHDAYFTVSPGLADDVSELCVKLGVANAVQRRAGRKGILPSGKMPVAVQEAYSVATRARSEQELRNGDGKDRLRVDQYRGMVYCATVPSGSLVVRRNGKVSICGNCDLIPGLRGTPQWEPNWDENHPDFKAMIACGIGIGLVSGSSWETFRDYPHFQLGGLPVTPTQAMRVYLVAHGLEDFWTEFVR